MLVLDSGAVTYFAHRSEQVVARIRNLNAAGLWPPLVPSVVLVECLTGHAGHDANVNRFLKGCEIAVELPEASARRAAMLRARARRGSAVDALVVVAAEPGGTVLTQDLADLRALAARASRVHVARV